MVFLPPLLGDFICYHYLGFQFNFNLFYLVNGFIMKEVVKVRAGWVWGEGKVLKTLENSIKVVQNKG